MSKGRKVHSICLAVILLLLFCIICSQLIPRIFLFNNLKRLVGQLQYEYKESPIDTITKTLDLSEGESISLDIQAKDERGKQYHFLTKIQENRVFVQGSHSSSDPTIHFSAYLDRKCMVVSSDALNEGYYGLTYDTFLRDLQSIPMLHWIISDKTAKEWNASLEKFKSFPEIPKIPRIPLNKADLFQAEKLLRNLLFVLPASIKKTTLSIDNGLCEATRIAYQFRPSQISDFVASEIPLSITEDQIITAVFYLSDFQLVVAEVQMETGERCSQYKMEAVNSEEKEGLEISCTSTKNGDLQRITAFFSNRSDNFEEWKLRYRHGCLDLSWYPAENRIDLSDDKEITTSFYLERASDGFSIETSNIQPFLKMLGDDWHFLPDKKVFCNIFVEKGSDFETPEYKNLDDWTFEDFLTLMDGVGNLIGWSFTK